MQLTDPVAEAAMDLGDDSESSGSELTDDILDKIQAAEQAVASDPGNYDAHVSVRLKFCTSCSVGTSCGRVLTVPSCVDVMSLFNMPA